MVQEEACPVVGMEAPEILRLDISHFPGARVLLGAT